MGVGEYHTRIFLACLLSIQITITFFGPLHFYLLRKGARKRITCALWSDVFFVSGWVIVMGLGWYIIRRCVVGEIRVRQIAANELEVMMYFATETVGKTFLVCFILCVASIWSFKMAFVCYYGDLYNRVVTIRKHALYFTAVFVPSSFVAAFVLALTECRPLSLSWDVDRLLQTGQFCSPLFSRHVQIVIVALTVSSDLLLIALPLHILSSLTLTTPEKRGVAFVFFIASISIAAAVGRFLVLNKRGAYNVDKGGEDQISFDKYYWTVVLAFLEIAAAEIAFVLPALRKVLLDRGRKHGPEKTKAVRVALVEEDEEDDVSVDRTAPEVVV